MVADSSTSTGLKWAAASAGALTLVKTDSFSAASAVAVDSVFTSTYTNYLLQIDFDQSLAYETNFRWRAGGSDKTGTNYKLSVTRTNNTGGASTGNETIAYIPIVYQGSTGQKIVSMEIFAPQASGRKTNVLLTSYAAGTPSVALVGDLYDVAESHDGFKLYVDGGTITGNYWLYGYQKS